MGDVESNAEKDKQYKEMLTVKNEAENLINSSEKSLAEYSDKIEKTDQDNIKSDISSLKDSLEKEKLEDIKTNLEKLKKSSQKIGEIIYNESQKNAPGDKNQDAKNSEIDAI